MNYKALFLLLFTLQHAYQLILNVVQHRSAANPTPQNVADVYDPETYRKWRAYHGEKSKLDILRTAVSWALTMVLLACSFHAAAASLFPQTVFMQLLGVILVQTLVETVVFLGFSWYDTMVIEQKYGFNRSTMRTFVIDQVRGFIIEIVLGVILMGLLALIHQAMGDWVVLLFTGVVFAFTLTISFLYGPVFSRLGNKFVPLEEGELKDKLLSLLSKHGYQVKAIEVMDASRRTTKLNAYFTGFGKLKSIVLFDNLLTAMSTDEIVAVFAHELGHGLHKDVLKQQMMNLGNLLIMSLLVWVTVREPAMHQAFGFDGVNYGFAFILLGGLLSLVQPLTGMVMSAYSRHAEYRADAQAVKEGYGEALVGGLKKLARENFANLAPSKALVVLEYSHPPLSERIAAIEAKK
ncbi:MAG: M48 family metallopeptidase [Clostridiales bacterium]|nr:M48 family metallopeptidase [Clostridiales bacterium]